VGGGAVAAAGLGPLLEMLPDVDARQVSASDPSVRALVADWATRAVEDSDNFPSTAAFASVVSGQLRWVCQLGDVPDRHRAAIDTAACQLSGALAFTGDLDGHQKALLMGIKARLLADGIGDPGLRAWARAQQALAALAAGLSREAIELAEDGLRVSPRGAHRARLLFLRARALAGMGRIRDVREAVAEGLDATHEDDDARQNTITLSPYCRTLGTWEATRALAAAGDLEAACAYAEHALEAFDREGVPAPSGRIELAIRLASQDPARAAQLVSTAVDQLRHVVRYEQGVVCLREFAARTRRLDAAEIREARQEALELVLR
jgi:tetratricopeptide (TPR) repeat protein